MQPAMPSRPQIVVVDALLALRARLDTHMPGQAADPGGVAVTEARRLARRLEKYRDELFTFLSHPEVPATNNHGEREVRSAVIWRKVMQGNRSNRGAGT